MSTAEVTVEMPEAPISAPRKKAKLWLRLLVALLAVAALAGLAELALRAIIPTVIAGVVRDNMGLPKDHPVEVDLKGSALFPALTGHVNNVSMKVDSVSVFDGIEANLFAYAESVPFDPSKGEIIGARAAVTIPSKSMNSVMALVSNGLIDEGSVRDGEIELGRTMQMFGYDVPLKATLAVSVDRGDLLVRPTSVSAAGFDLSTEELRPLLGESAATFLDTHVVCVRDQLPAGITLSQVAFKSNVFGGSATVSAKLSPDLLSNERQLQPGTCPAP
ncbi:LmeA family phospholipid-binding protein [Leucobacter sp. UT-8R-CII-1-4]|uniref:LmeA family phospholipid-binding protein n=1 Tax=Leucobacter sp. UT-8R-CII-1-4 TaxID=3040075 RepID=UPI0024A9F461|nr:LmeA family phospholipid-binding protein [Leucobacter sp. UT-8R-CII-1-4]MDI6022120.1 LmeA family phospholipid-binding protein [Leucobacter sp. UT-8R-CII-1-4]